MMFVGDVGYVMGYYHIIQGGGCLFVGRKFYETRQRDFPPARRRDTKYNGCRVNEDDTLFCYSTSRSCGTTSRVSVTFGA